jgi:hypothetical protein
VHFELQLVDLHGKDLWASKFKKPVNENENENENVE